MLKQWKHQNKHTAYSDTDIVSTFVDIWALPIPCQECNGQSLGPCCLVVPCCLAVVPAVCFEGPTPGDLRHVPKCTFRALDVKDDLHLFGYRRHNTNFVTIKSCKPIMGSLSLSCFELFSMFWNHKSLPRSTCGWSHLQHLERLHPTSNAGAVQRWAGLLAPSG